MGNWSLYKMRFSALWLVWLVTDLQLWALMLIEPGFIDEIRTGAYPGSEVGTGFLLLGAVVALVPLVMVVLPLILKDSLNRWVNIIVGVVYTILGLTNIIEQLTDPSAHRILMILAQVVFSALIIWYAWKWPKQEARK